MRESADFCKICHLKTTDVLSLFAFFFAFFFSQTSPSWSLSTYTKDGYIIYKMCPHTWHTYQCGKVKLHTWRISCQSACFGKVHAGFTWLLFIHKISRLSWPIQRICTSKMLENASDFLELFKSFPVSISVLLVVPIALLSGHGSPAMAAHEFPVFRMQQFDLQQTLKGKVSLIEIFGVMRPRSMIVRSGR